MVTRLQIHYGLSQNLCERQVEFYIINKEIDNTWKHLFFIWVKSFSRVKICRLSLLYLWVFGL